MPSALGLGKPDKPKIPPTRAAPPTPTGVEGAAAAEEVKARARRRKGRAASRINLPGAFDNTDVNILRPTLKENFR